MTRLACGLRPATVNHRFHLLYRTVVFPPRRHPLVLCCPPQRCFSVNSDTIDEATIVREYTGIKRRDDEQEVEQIQQRLRQAMKLLQQKDQDSNTVPLLAEVRDCYEQLQDFAAASQVEETLREHLDGTREEQAASFYRQGKLCMQMQELTSAQKCYQQALDLYPKQTQQPEKGNIIISMAGVAFHRDQHQQALELLQQAEAHFLTNSTPHPDYVKCLQHQGLVYRSRAEFTEAMEKYQQALALANPEDTERYLALQLDIADVLVVLEQYDQAVDLYRSLVPEEEDVLSGILWHNIGKVHMQQQNYDQARADLERAVDIKTRWVGEHSLETQKSLQALGALYAVTERKVEAMQCFQKALLIARIYAEDSATDPNVLFALRNLDLLRGQAVPKWGDDDDKK